MNGYRGNIDDDSLYTFAYIDIDGTGASVTTVDHDTRDEAAILDVTF